MLRKSSRVAFGGMWLFPGGRVDASPSAAGPGIACGCSTPAGATSATSELIAPTPGGDFQRRDYAASPEAAASSRERFQ